MSDDKQKYGLLTYSSINIGDEIQSLAAMRFLPHIDYYIHRERTDHFSTEDHEKVKLIMAAWWMQEPKHFPPSEDIAPLFVSFCATERRREKILSKESVAYLKSYEPIGCRDLSTKRFLEEAGISAYFTGCLTSTLVPNEKLRGKYVSDYVLCIDVPEEMIKVVRASSDRPVYCFSNSLSPALKVEDRLRLAKYMLFLYHNAHCVYTRRLHVALPCTAYGTRVCLIKEKDFDRRGRFDGMEDLFNEIGVEQYIENPKVYDVNNPPDNPDGYLTIRDGLVKSCYDFTNCDRGGILEDTYNPLMEVPVFMRNRKGVIPKMCMFADNSTLIDILKRKMIGKKTLNDEQDIYQYSVRGWNEEI